MELNEVETKIEEYFLSRRVDLDLTNMDLTELPESLNRLTHLKMINLYGNPLRTLPSWFSRFRQLEGLQIGGIELSDFPEVLRNLKQLKWIRIHNNLLVELPSWVGELTELTSLDLSGNQLTDLPDEIFKLKNLVYLDLGLIAGNPLKTLPESIRKLTKLEVLSANRCHIESVPAWIGELTKLKDIRLSSNKLKDLPAALGRLDALKLLNIDNNPLNPELAAANKEGIDTIKRYLRQKAEAEVVLNEAKLILIGEGTVGKSCLLGTLCGMPWEQLEDLPTTHGIRIKPVKVTESDKGTEITLNAWDFGGQRSYRPTHQLFFSAPAVYLVVWNSRQGWQQGSVKEWIKLVKHREPDSKILIVATHCSHKESQADIDRQEFWDLFGKETLIDFIQVDSKPQRYDKTKKKWIGKCKGIKELKDAIAKVAISLPEFGQSLPKKWLEVRDALKGTGEPYMSLEQVLAICRSDPQKMSEADASDFIRISHRLGHLIHYGQDPDLKDIVILKPDWLSTAMSFVLNDDETRKNHGLIKMSRLSRLWNDSSRSEEFRYASRIHPMFIALMHRFDLSYRVAGSPLGGKADGTYLIAQLVPDIKPEVDLDREWPKQLPEGFEQQVQICRIVDAKGNSVTAEGLFCRLIVRLHKFSLGREDFNKSVHWHRGLLIEDGYNGRALLEYKENNVWITVRATYPSYLLGLLTGEVEWLVEDFWEGLRCELVVPCIDPCGKQQPGLGMFEVQKLIAFRQQKAELFPCPVSGCYQAQNIDCLLKNAPIQLRTNTEFILADGFTEMRIKLTELLLQNREMNQTLVRMVSQVKNAFEGIMRTITNEGKNGPKLFSLHPIERSAFNPKGWVMKSFRVTLWCEHTQLPLPLINMNEDKGVYTIDVTHEWFSKAAPFLKALSTIMILVLPVALKAAQLFIEEDRYKEIQNQLEFSKKCAETMFKATNKLVEWSEEKDSFEIDDKGLIMAEGGVLREFQSWLKKKDPTFGDLRCVLTNRQEYLWVHDKYVNHYSSFQKLS